MPHFAGESCGAVDAIEPAAVVVRRLVADAEALLAQASTRRVITPA
jgi:hypothetical protein